jgi:hypothetical protein
VHHVVGYRRLGKRETEFEQLAVDAGCSPKRIRQAHLVDEVLNILRNLAAPKPQASALPPPVGAESGAMPTYHRIWFEDARAEAHPEA